MAHVKRSHFLQYVLYRTVHIEFTKSKQKFSLAVKRPLSPVSQQFQAVSISYTDEITRQGMAHAEQKNLSCGFTPEV
jgi:hypothetical protein